MTYEMHDVRSRGTLSVEPSLCSFIVSRFIRAPWTGRKVEPIDSPKDDHLADSIFSAMGRSTAGTLRRPPARPLLIRSVVDTPPCRHSRSLQYRHRPSRVLRAGKCSPFSRRRGVYTSDGTEEGTQRWHVPLRARRPRSALHMRRLWAFLCSSWMLSTSPFRSRPVNTPEHRDPKGCVHEGAASRGALTRFLAPGWR